jgi:hypothetical protein
MLTKARCYISFKRFLSAASTEGYIFDIHMVAKKIPTLKDFLALTFSTFVKVFFYSDTISDTFSFFLFFEKF